MVSDNQVSTDATKRPRLVTATSRQRWTGYYTSFISIIGVSLILTALLNLPQDWPGLLVFCGLAVLAELLSVELFSTSRFSRVSISAIISISVVLIYGPFGAAILGATIGLVTIYTNADSGSGEADGRRASWLRRGLFNLGMLVISNLVAGLVYLGAGGQVGEPAQLSNLIPLTLAVATNELLNLLILLGVLTIQTGRSPVEIFQQNFAWAVQIGILSGAIGGGALAMAYEMFHLLGLMVFLLPVVSTSYSLRLYVKHTKEYVSQLEEMNRTLDDSNLGLLETMAAVIDAYDVYTFGHSAQVAVYVEALAEKLHIPEAEQAILIKAALVHDIGKVGIADTIIGKPGPLTDEEYRIVQRHPIIGADILRRTPGLQQLVPLVRHHHERWDGSGYPAGLAGEEIPLGARLIAVADAVDAMISARPYRKVQTLEAVIAEAQRCSGTQFDPQVVRAFLEVVADKGQDFFVDSGTPIQEDAREKGLNGKAIRARYMKRSMLVD